MLNKDVLKNIYNDLLELSSEEIQIRSWLNSDSDVISNYTELMCRLYDDSAFDEFVDNEIYTLNISNNMIRNLKELKIMLDNYELGNNTYQDVIYDPKWIEIREKAKNIINSWDIEFEDIL